ncbi:hypothetical protein BLA60_36925 [Actinophytocola xinjiangensis]|uniref:SUKH-3 immunity protein of toxin-antitoxin system n=1 Tax=Actinophytocola xinjiangensis TaxID=485602 RepID=A0A7Z0WE51_9PSEU|nr:SUKH-3 domain-containing protein [Actinophytocola xinjiangensis]OLF05243.1 hypothetical protein BLA60_36925 [Actinophytocola xinjiangensis]
MNKLSATQYLERSGWFPGRRVEIDRDLKAFRDEECETFDQVTEFLREFSGLTIGFMRYGSPDELWFAADRACESVSLAWAEDYSQRVGVAMLPVGAAYREYLTILIDENGAFYGGFDDEFGSLGVGVLEMVDNIVQNRGFIDRF